MSISIEVIINCINDEDRDKITDLIKIVYPWAKISDMNTGEDLNP